MADACETLFQKCYQNEWVNSDEKSTFLKNCRDDQPRKGPGIQPPANMFAMNIMPALLRDISAAGGTADFRRCRGYAGGTVHREAVAVQTPWYVTSLAWITAAASAALFIAGVRTFPMGSPAGIPAGYGFGTTPPSLCEHPNIL